MVLIMPLKNNEECKFKKILGYELIGCCFSSQLLYLPIAAISAELRYPVGKNCMVLLSLYPNRPNNTFLFSGAPRNL